jgi:hypothetical protein
VKTTLLRASLLLGASLWAGPALAQDSDTMTVQSQVAPFCSELSVSSAPMNLGSLTGPTGQIVPSFGSGAETERELAASFYCNAPATVTITATPLITPNTTTDTSSFTSRVDYTATLVWDDVNGNVSSTVTGGATIGVPEANIGPMKLTLSNPAVVSNRRPVAGDYTGQVTLTVALAQ